VRAPCTVAAADTDATSDAAAESAEAVSLSAPITA
jgi:hypothetical protein